MTSYNQSKTERARYNYADIAQDEVIELAEDSEQLTEFTDTFESLIPDYNPFEHISVNLARASELIELGVDYEKVKEEADALREFWNDAWYQLDKVYPCPSVTSDHDKGVMLDTIRAGDKVLNRINALENDTALTEEEVAELTLLRGLTS